jgi:hypothetical protein
MRDEEKKLRIDAFTKSLGEPTKKEFKPKRDAMHGREETEETPGDRAIKKIRADFARRVSASS